MFRLIIFLLVVAGAVLFFANRPGRGPPGTPVSVTVAQLQAAPARWEGEQVRVSGVVGGRFAVLGFGGFTLRDDGGQEVIVIGTSDPVWSDQPITVEGRYMTVLAVNDVSRAVILVRGE